MKLCPLSACQLAFLSLCCVLVTVRQSNGTFVPGRCLCPETQDRVRGQLKDLTVIPKSGSCNKITVIVTLKNSETRCVNPEGPMGSQLVRCWNRAHNKGRDAKLCLKRKRRGRGGGGQRSLRSQQRSRGLMRRASSSHKSQ
uniref:C-X-C motif chemokine 10-like n=1 Tax=Semicossyphus pulcher TaxID=241346 RepID=UPI0037E76688